MRCCRAGRSRVAPSPGTHQGDQEKDGEEEKAPPRWVCWVREGILQTERLELPLAEPGGLGLPSSTERLDVGEGVAAWWVCPASAARCGWSVLYLHGVSGSRARPHRADTVRLLLRLGCRVLAPVPVLLLLLPVP